MKRINIILIIVAVIIIVLGIVFSFAAPNFSVDLTGGSSVTVVLNSEFDEGDYDKAFEKAENVLKKLNIRIESSEKISFATDSDVGFRFLFQNKINGKKASSAALTNLGLLLSNGGATFTSEQKASLDKHLGSNFDYASFTSLGDGINSVISTTRTVSVSLEQIGPSAVIWSSVKSVAMTCSIALAAICVYALIRFIKLGYERNGFLNGLRSALVIIISFVVNILVAVALSIVLSVVTTVPLGSMFAYAIAVSILFAFALSMLMLNRIKESQDLKAGNLTETAVKKSFIVSLIMVASIIVVSVVSAIFGEIITWGFVVAVSAGAISAAYTTLFILPLFWNILKLKFRSSEKIKTENEEI